MRRRERCCGQWSRRIHQQCPLLYGWACAGILLVTSLYLMCRRKYASCLPGSGKVTGTRQSIWSRLTRGFVSASNQVWPSAPLSTSWCSRTGKWPSCEYLQLIVVDWAAALCLSTVFFPFFEVSMIAQLSVFSAPTWLPQIYCFWFRLGASSPTIPNDWTGPGEQDRTEPLVPLKL